VFPLGDLKIFSGNANRALAKSICDQLVDVKLGNAQVDKFPDGEINVKVHEDVRGRDVFIVQPTCAPVNQNLMELLILVDCLRRASAGRITAVIPYYGYARKDRKDEGRVPITAKLVANMIVTSGVDRVLTMDLHAQQIQGFFGIPVEHLYASPVIVDYLRKKTFEKLVVLAPDAGSAKMAQAFNAKLGGSIALIDKNRVTASEVQLGAMVGSVKDSDVVIPDDMISTAGSIVQAATIAKDQGAKRVTVCATHAVLVGSAVERLSNAPIDEVIVTDTIPAAGKQFDKLKVISVAGLLARAIKRIHQSESVSQLFNAGE
jgi:ribose-phosphate pyrophosphokinase